MPKGLRIISFFISCAGISLCFVSRVPRIALMGSTGMNSSARDICDYLKGLWSNKEQADAAAAAGLPSAKSGGHEWVQCRIISHPTEEKRLVLVASYFLDGDPRKTFRYRFYEFVDSQLEKSGYVAAMKIYRPREETGQRLSEAEYDSAAYIPELVEMEYLPECDLGWSISSKSDDYGIERGFSGTLLGSGILNSEMLPLRRIRVEDELFVSAKILLINDKVYDADSGEQLIGNTKGIPYILVKERVE